MDPLRAAGVPVERGRERVAVARLGAGRALGQADGLAVGDVDGGQQLEAVGHAWSPGVGGGGQGRDPVGEHLGAGVAGLLRVELEGGEGAVLDGGDEPGRAGRPGDERDDERACRRASRRAAGTCGRRRSARSRTRRRRGRRTAASPCGASTGARPVGHDGRRPTPGHSPRPSARPRAGPRTSRACPTPIASTGRPPASRRSTTWSRADGQQAGHDARRTAPTPAIDEPVGLERRCACRR